MVGSLVKGVEGGDKEGGGFQHAVEVALGYEVGFDVRWCCFIVFVLGADFSCGSVIGGQRCSHLNQNGVVLQGII